MKDTRLGFYLIPSYPLAKELQVLRLVLQDQFGLSAALRFMTHMTIKGFFKPASGYDIEELYAAADMVMEKNPEFELKQSGFRIDNTGCYLWFNPEDNALLQKVHEDIISAFDPFISEDCDFSRTEDVNSSFNPHMTLAMTDISENRRNDVINFLNKVDLEQKIYRPGCFRLFEFTSNDWKSNTDHWINSLQWKILKTWEL